MDNSIHKPVGRWWIMVVLLVAVALITVECNYTIASGSGQTSADEMRGDTKGAKERGHQAVKEAKETAETWTNWGKDKILGSQDSGGGLKGKSEITEEASGKAKGAHKQVKDKPNEVVDAEL